MEAPSTSDDVQHFIKKQEEEEEESLPYHSLLVELHALIKQHQFWSSAYFNPPFTRQEIWILQQDLKLQQMIFMLLLNHGVTSQSLHQIQIMAESEIEQIQCFVARLANFVPRRFSPPAQRESVLKLLETLHCKIKPHLKEFCAGIVHRLLQGNSSSSSSGIGNGEYGIFAFINVILFKLKDFQNLKPNFVDPVKNQMQFLLKMLNYVPIIAKKMTNTDDIFLQNLLEFLERWVNTAAAIVILYWIDDSDEKAFARVFSSSLQKLNLSILEKVEVYILLIRALRPSNASEILLMRNTVEQFIEMILETFVVSKDDRFREGLAFWTALLVDPPKSDVEHEKLICEQTQLLLDQAKSLICSMCLCEDIALLNDFQEKINEAKAQVRQLQAHQILGLSCNNDPKANTRGHFDLLLENLQKKFEVEAGLLPFEKHLIAIVHYELSLLRPSLFGIFELQHEHDDLRYIWVQASNIAYNVDYVTDFCLASTDIPIWSNLIQLSNAIEKIQFIKTQVSKINDQMYNNIVMSVNLNSQLVLPARQETYDATVKDDFKVGYIEEEQRLIDFLVAGEAGRNIVAIFGMSGQGKTHLAQRVFRNTNIKYHFTKLAWCCISQSYDIEKIFRDILKDVGDTMSPVSYQCVPQEDLADVLRKQLKGQRYLIVIDDMWDAKAWFDLELSFPDDENGSRILLTTQNRDVALKVKPKCSIVELNPFSLEESWNLLQMKVFHGDCCPPTLSKIGKAVAENCKGLPLAIVVVAGLLKKDKNVESWKQICESLKPLIAMEGCMDIVELSYKRLPNYLKPCFLYLGAFREDQIIDTEQLMKFWIAEGFVQSDGIKTREGVAKEYLMDLVSRSLIFVARRSSRNEIKKCFVHDLLHQLCHIKVEEERFMLVLNDKLDLSTLNNNDFRISSHVELEPFLDSKPVFPGLRSLLVSVSWTNFDYGTLCFLKEFKLIRVLDLSFTTVNFDNISQLIHLRLLTVFDISNPIPPSIVNLLKLEVLRIYTNAKVILLPSVVTKMASLRHIFASKCTIECYDELVPDMSSSPLTNFETLTTIYFDDELSFKMVAPSLQNILRLSIECGYCFRLSSCFKRLESLKLLLTDQTLQYGVISPSTLDFPSTLKTLNLRVCRWLSVDMISLIGKLTHLEVLKLVADFENDRWDVEDDEFLQLKYLDLRFSSIKEWNVSDESFPCLEQVIIRYCSELGELPDRFSLVTTLRRIEVHDCNESLKNSFQQIVDDQLDSGNEDLQYSFQ